MAKMARESIIMHAGVMGINYMNSGDAVHLEGLKTCRPIEAAQMAILIYDLLVKDQGEGAGDKFFNLIAGWTDLVVAI